MPALFKAQIILTLFACLLPGACRHSGKRQAEPETPLPQEPIENPISQKNDGEPNNPKDPASTPSDPEPKPQKPSEPDAPPKENPEVPPVVVPVEPPPVVIDRDKASCIPPNIWQETTRICLKWRQWPQADLDRDGQCSAKEDCLLEDLSSGLIWGPRWDFKERTYEEAKSFCKNLSLLQLQGWQMPTEEHLKSSVVADYRNSKLGKSESLNTYWSWIDLPKDDKAAVFYFDSSWSTWASSNAATKPVLCVLKVKPL